MIYHDWKQVRETAVYGVVVPRINNGIPNLVADHKKALETILNLIVTLLPPGGVANRVSLGVTQLGPANSFYRTLLQHDLDGNRHNNNDNALVFP